MLTLLLVSRSPRRKQLLQEAGFEFTSYSLEVSEKLSKNMSLQQATEALARRKSEAFLQAANPLQLEGKLVLTGDTLVGWRGRLLGKPKNRDEALNYLGLLSGQGHEVVT